MVAVVPAKVVAAADFGGIDVDNSVVVFAGNEVPPVVDPATPLPPS